MDLTYTLITMQHSFGSLIPILRFATPTVNGNEFVATSNAWIKTIDEPGYYRVRIEQNGCQSLLASDDLELDTFNLPSPLITSNSPICDNSPIVLTAVFYIHWYACG